MCFVPDLFGPWNTIPKYPYKDQPCDAANNFVPHGPFKLAGLMNAWDNKRGIDVILEHYARYVDRTRIGLVGFSYGGSQGVVTAAFDERIIATAAICGVDPPSQGPSKPQFDCGDVLKAVIPRHLFIRSTKNEFDLVEGVIADVKKEYTNAVTVL
jgi:dienelactone hydrolase